MPDAVTCSIVSASIACLLSCNGRGPTALDVLLYQVHLRVQTNPAAACLSQSMTSLSALYRAPAALISTQLQHRHHDWPETASTCALDFLARVTDGDNGPLLPLHPRL